MSDGNVYVLLVSCAASAVWTWICFRTGLSAAYHITKASRNYGEGGSKE